MLTKVPPRVAMVPLLVLASTAHRGPSAPYIARGRRAPSGDDDIGAVQEGRKALLAAPIDAHPREEEE